MFVDYFSLGFFSQLLLSNEAKDITKNLRILTALLPRFLHAGMAEDLQEISLVVENYLQRIIPGCFLALPIQVRIQLLSLLPNRAIIKRQIACNDC